MTPEGPNEEAEGPRAWRDSGSASRSRERELKLLQPAPCLQIGAEKYVAQNDMDQV